MFHNTFSENPFQVIPLLNANKISNYSEILTSTEVPMHSIGYLVVFQVQISRNMVLTDTTRHFNSINLHKYGLYLVLITIIDIGAVASQS